MITSNPIIPFGKFKGKKCSEIDVQYLDWLIGQPWLKPDLEIQIVAHLKNRADWDAMDCDASVEDLY